MTKQSYITKRIHEPNPTKMVQALKVVLEKIPEKEVKKIG